MFGKGEGILQFNFLEIVSQIMEVVYDKIVDLISQIFFSLILILGIVELIALITFLIIVLGAKEQG